MHATGDCIYLYKCHVDTLPPSMEPKEGKYIESKRLDDHITLNVEHQK